MLELSGIREAPDRLKAALKARGWSPERTAAVVEELLHLDKERRRLLTASQEAQAAANKASRVIGTHLRQQDHAAAARAKKEVTALKVQASDAGSKAKMAQQALETVLMGVPNIPHASVPAGQSTKDNAVQKVCGHRPAFDFTPRPHWELAEALGLIDFKRGAKVAGTGFPFFVGQGARIQRALIRFFLEEAVRAGYTEVQPPLLVNESSARGTGNLPDKEGQMYQIQGHDLYLIPTAEVPLTNLYRQEVLREEVLPLKLCGYTPCWRREAGSYGKRVRGLNRLHQFDKVEVVCICAPGNSYDALEEMVRHAEQILEKLELPYRRLLMCTGDMGFNQTKQYDLEVWAAGQVRWLEVSSVSNFESFQARRLQLRCRPSGGGKPHLAHTLNGSALALPRIIAAILENNQLPDGSVAIPPIVSRYAGMDQNWIISP